MATHRLWLVAFVDRTAFMNLFRDRSSMIELRVEGLHEANWRDYSRIFTDLQAAGYFEVKPLLSAGNQAEGLKDLVVYPDDERILRLNSPKTE